MDGIDEDGSASGAHDPRAAHIDRCHRGARGVEPAAAFARWRLSSASFASIPDNQRITFDPGSRSVYLDARGRARAWITVER